MHDCSSEVKQGKKKKGKKTLFIKLKLSLSHLAVALPSMLLGCEKMLTTWIMYDENFSDTDIFPILKFWEILAS